MLKLSRCSRRTLQCPAASIATMEAREIIRGLLDWRFDCRSVEKVWRPLDRASGVSGKARASVCSPGFASWRLLHMRTAYKIQGSLQDAPFYI